LVDNVRATNRAIPAGVITPGSRPVPGDVMSFWGGALDSRGHTAVVISAPDANGNFKIMSQNYPVGKAGEQTVHIDMSGQHNGPVQIDNSVWTHAKFLVLSRGMGDTSARVAVGRNLNGRIQLFMVDRNGIVLTSYQGGIHVNGMVRVDSALRPNVPDDRCDRRGEHR
jgi:hypothetical protein